MNKDEFNKLVIEEQVKVFNRYVKECGGMRKACQTIGIGRTTIRDRFKKAGYVSTGNEYIKNTDTPIEKENAIVEPVCENKQDINILETNNNTIDVSQLESIIENKITSLLEKYLKNDKPKGNIELSSRCEGDVKYSSYGVYKNISEEFHEYVKKHPRYTKVELVSQALLNFMNEHK